MYARRISCGYQRWRYLFQPSKHLIRRDGLNGGGSHSFAKKSVDTAKNHSPHYSLIEISASGSFASHSVSPGSDYPSSQWNSKTFLSRCQSRKYSSEGNGGNASEGKHSPVKDTTNLDGKSQREKFGGDVRLFDAHAQLGEQDQKECLGIEKLAIESKILESPYLTTEERLKKELLQRVVPWEKLTVSWKTFPYYLHDHTKNLLVECAASHLKHKRFTASYGARLRSSSGRILLQSFPGTELYRERLVKALAHDLQVPLLMLDNCVLDPYYFDESEFETDDDNAETCEYASDSEVGNEKEDWMNFAEVISDFFDNDDIDVQKTEERARKFAALDSEKMEKIWDKMMYDKRSKDEDLDQLEDCYMAMETLCEVICSIQPLIVYFRDFSQWLSWSIPKSYRKEFVHEVQAMFDQLSVPVVLISGQNKVESESEEKGKFPLSLKRLTEGVKGTKRSDDNKISKLFSNILHIYPPKEDDILRTFNKQLDEDKRFMISRSNLNEIHEILEEHEMSCVSLLHANTDGVILTEEKADKVVGWAKNHYLSNCKHPLVSDGRLHLPTESLEMGISRLKEHELKSREPSQSLKNLSKDEYETNFVSAVVPPGEIGVKFEDIGALEDVKRALNELVILPMRRPELFSRGNLLRPCKGILLFGPPGTGKTLLAKALATEAGANFISITGSTLTSKWFGDTEKLTKALFSFASKLSPVIIFVDEVDSLLGARGGAFEHEATRRMRNEFMAAWDGLRTKDSQRILILGATNRPFDLDDAVIRHLPRRIYVDLPDAENRLKILKIFLAQENVETEFPFDELAHLTEGYSGSDLKNLCIAAAYRPVEELLAAENRGVKNDEAPVPRPLRVDDFIRAKTKVGPSVAYDAASMNELRKWNEQHGEGGSRRNSPFGFGNS